MDFSMMFQIVKIERVISECVRHSRHFYLSVTAFSFVMDEV